MDYKSAITSEQMRKWKKYVDSASTNSLPVSIGFIIPEEDFNPDVATIPATEAVDSAQNLTP